MCPVTGARGHLVISWKPSANGQARILSWKHLEKELTRNAQLYQAIAFITPKIGTLGIACIVTAENTAPLNVTSCQHLMRGKRSSQTKGSALVVQRVNTALINALASCRAACAVDVTTFLYANKRLLSQT